MSDVESTPETVANARPQFGIKALLTATTVVAGTLALLSWFDVFGGIVVLTGAVVYTLLAGGAHRAPAHHLAFDLIWGIGMPLVALTLDAYVAKNSSGYERHGLACPIAWQQGKFVLHPWAITASAALGYPMFILCLWRLRELEIRRAAAVVAGTLGTAATACGLLGLMLQSQFTDGNERGAGLRLLGLTTLAAAWTYFRHARHAWQAAKTALQPGWKWTGALLGVILSLGLPIMAYFLGDAWRGGPTP
jgi:hypothetical protein